MNLFLKIPGKTPAAVHRNDVNEVQTPGDVAQVFPRQYGVLGDELAHDTCANGVVDSAEHSWNSRSSSTFSMFLSSTNKTKQKYFTIKVVQSSAHCGPDLAQVNSESLSLVPLT